MTLTPVLSAYWDEQASWTLDSYRRHDGYQALDKALDMAPDDVIALVKESGLRGRGGAGFPTGQKWSFIPQGTEGAAAKPTYSIVGEKLGCSVDSSGMVKIGSTPGKITVRAGSAKSFDEVVITITAPAPKPAPAAGSGKTAGLDPSVVGGEGGEEGGDHQDAGHADEAA